MSDRRPAQLDYRAPTDDRDPLPWPTIVMHVLLISTTFVGFVAACMLLFIFTGW